MSDTSEYEVVASDGYAIDVTPRTESGEAAVRITDFTLDGRTLQSVTIEGQLQSLGNERLIDMAVDLTVPAVGYESRLGEGGDKTTITPSDVESPAGVTFEASPNVDLGSEAGNSVEIEAELLMKRHWGE